MIKKEFISEYLSETELEKISEAIKKVESKTSGELRVSIRKNRGYREKEFSPRELAVREFLNLGMNQTSDKTGVLFFILFDERKFEIIADEGINSIIGQDEWEKHSSEVSNKFSSGDFLGGILYVINSVGEILIKEFPVKAGDKNELSDEVVIG